MTPHPPLTRTHPAGATLRLEPIPDSEHHIDAGLVAAHTNASTGARAITVILRAGDVVPDALKDVPFELTAVTDVSVTLRDGGTDPVPILLRALRTAPIVTAPVADRLELLLAELARGADSASVPLTHRTLAGLLDTQRSAVTRALVDLRKRGLVARTRRKQPITLEGSWWR